MTKVDMSLCSNDPATYWEIGEIDRELVQKDDGYFMITQVSMDKSIVDQLEKVKVNIFSTVGKDMRLTSASLDGYRLGDSAVLIEDSDEVVQKLF